MLPKPVGQYKVVGTRVARRDIPDKASGRHVYVQHVRLPGMLHGRLVRPRGQGALGAGPRVVSIDPEFVQQIPDVQIVHRRDFVGVVAPREWDAVRAAQQLKVTWDAPATLPGNDKLFEYFRAAKTSDDLVVDGDMGPLERAPHLVKATYNTPYLSHGTMAPNCAVAQVTAEGALVMSSTLRFGEHPAVTPIVVQRPMERSSGAGEEALPAVVAAIANAVFDATGVRLREFPMTPERVLAALGRA